jgi:hypothetical protein
VSSWRFWTFNVADSAVTIGAIVLAWSLSREDREEREAAALAPAPARATSSGDPVDSDAARGASGPDA